VAADQVRERLRELVVARVLTLVAKSVCRFISAWTPFSASVSAAVLSATSLSALSALVRSRRVCAICRGSPDATAP
jgi:hypothetical protein